MSGIVVYDDVIVPYSVVRASASGRLRRKNDRTVNQGGYATVNVVMDQTLREYTLGIRPMFLADWMKVHGAYEVTDAGAYGMLLEDPTDSRVSATEGALMGYMVGVESGTLGRGNGTPRYGLRKIYTAFNSTRARARMITRPKGSPVVRRNGVPVPIGAGAGNIALSAAPVYVTFVPDATRSVSSVTVGATTQIVLSSAIAGLVTTTGKLWLQGLSGADAALLNGLSHTIVGIAGATYTLATNTAGKTIAAGVGQGHKYPQPTETLSWSGDFYVPVQFASDEMDWDFLLHGEYDDRLIAGPSVPLIEIREA
ncbi:MAG: hypothetical protein ACT6R2_18730 [Blastomonas fulva]|jgi:hypothetical protein|uniref:hypothetical protein n=1 Tax=Pseudomonadota TaxID=1224 RepID=UPI0040332E18